MPTWAVAVIASILPAIASGIIASRAYVARARADLENQVRARLDDDRRRLYGDFVTMMMPLISGYGQEQTPEQAKLLNDLLNLRPRIIMHGSDEFLRALNCFTKFRAEGEPHEMPRARNLALIALVLQAIRRDLGYQKDEQDVVDILNVLVSDLAGNPTLEGQVRHIARRYKPQVRAPRRKWFPWKQVTN